MINKIKKILGLELPYGDAILEQLDSLRIKLQLFNEKINSSTTLNTALKSDLLEFSNIVHFLIINQSDLVVVTRNYINHTDNRKHNIMSSKSKNFLARQAAMLCYELLQDSKYLTGKKIQDTIKNVFSLTSSQNLLSDLNLVVQQRKKLDKDYGNIFKDIRNSTIAHKGHNAEITAAAIDNIKDLEIMHSTISFLKFITGTMTFLNTVLNSVLIENIL